jgi:DNA topoisomerase I
MPFGNAPARGWLFLALTTIALNMTHRQITTSDKDVMLVARDARLRYVSDRRPGLKRKRSGPGFRYVTADGKHANRAELGRIRELAIPPAWEQVWICPHPNGHLQATGRDAKGRKQYIYHAQWHAARKETKFHRLAQFGRGLPKIRRRVARDLRLRGLPRDKVVAAVVWLLEQTHIRIGNPEYADENQSFGLSTMRNRHVAVRGERFEFRFRGKSGKFHQVDFTNKRLARIVKRCQELPGYDLFQYIDAAGEIRNMTSDDVNDYLHAIAGEEFSAKDFRTWAGTIRAAQILQRLNGNDNAQPTASALVAAIDEVAVSLGNTRTVCRKYYIHPAIMDAYLDGTLKQWFTGPSPRPNRTGLSSEEEAVLRLLKRRYEVG